jgi:hypothetical protein
MIIKITDLSNPHAPVMLTLKPQLIILEVKILKMNSYK